MKRLRYFSIILGLFLILGIIAVCWAASKEVAEIQDCKGKVQILAKEAQADSWKPAYAKTVLHEGDRIRTVKDAKATLLFYKDMHTERLAGDVQVRLGDNNCMIEKGTKNNVQVGTAFQGIAGVQPINSISQKYMGVMQRGDIQLFAPKFKSSATTPSFVFDFVPADQYEISVMTDKKEVLHIVVKEKDAKTNDSDEVVIPYPQGTPPLENGVSYKWSVAAVVGKEAPSQGNADFTVATGEEISSIQKIREQLDAASKQNSEDLSPQLVLFSYYWDNGFIEDAYALCRELMKLRPDDANLQNWDKDLYKLRRAREIKKNVASEKTT